MQQRVKVLRYSNPLCQVLCAEYSGYSRMYLEGSGTFFECQWAKTVSCTRVLPVISRKVSEGVLADPLD